MPESVGVGKDQHRRTLDLRWHRRKRFMVVLAAQEDALDGV